MPNLPSRLSGYQANRGAANTSKERSPPRWTCSASFRNTPKAPAAALGLAPFCHCGGDGLGVDVGRLRRRAELQPATEATVQLVALGRPRWEA